MILFLFAAMLLAANSQARPAFHITLETSMAPKGTSGRLFVFMAKGIKNRERITTSFTPGETWFAAMDVEHYAPGQVIEFDPDSKAYPKPFTQAPAGDWEFMALLDADHSFANGGQGEGDIYSSVVGVKDWNPASAAPVALSLSKLTAARPALKSIDGIELVEFISPRLSAFWGRPITIQQTWQLTVFRDTFNKIY